jgi:spermidine/putrescine transport system permease protein
VTRRARVVSWIAVIAILAFLFAPVVLVVLFSFNESASTAPPFTGFTLRWYGDVIDDAAYVQAIKNTAVVAALTVAITTVVGTLGALALVRVSPRVATAVSALLAVPLIVPWLFTGLALLVFFTRIHVELSMATVVAGHVVVTAPIAALIVTARLARLDPAVNEAARDLGANAWQAFRRVLLPQIAPAIIGSALLVTATSADEFIITLFVNGGYQTVPLVIFTSLRTGLGPEINAIASMMLAFTLVLTVIASRFVSVKDVTR